MSRLPLTLATLVALIGLAAQVSAQAGAPATQSPTGVDTLWRAIQAPPIPIARPVLGDSSDAGPFRYYFKAPPGASIAAHRHSADMHIIVRTGRKFILMGDLDAGRVQRFEAGSSLVIPANTWHVEWWETETLEEVDGVGPMRTERASPTSPRVPVSAP